MHQAAQYNIILYNQLISVSKNGQILNKISLTWLKLFYKYIKGYTISIYQLLVLDSYGSYINPEFNQFCLDYQIIIICILAHLLYLLQLLDIGCFLALKQAYRHSVKQIMYYGVNYINKYEFLPLYIQARQLALYQNNIQAGFVATRLVLYSPNRVLGLLYAEYQILLPQYRL